MPSGSRWVPPAIEVAWTDTAAVPVRRPTRSGGGGRVERCETWLTAPLPPTRRRMRWPRPSSLMPKPTSHRAKPKQMSESELERELHRRGQEWMRRLLQGHLDQRTPGRPPVRSRGSTMSSARSGVCRNATRRRPSGRCRLRARAGRARRWRRDAARPRERRRPTLRCGNRPHPRGRVRLQGGACVPSPPASSKGVRYLVRDRDGVHWCTLVLPSTAVSSMRGSGSAGWPTGLEPRRF